MIKGHSRLVLIKIVIRFYDLQRSWFLMAFKYAGTILKFKVLSLKRWVIFIILSRTKCLRHRYGVIALE